MGGEAAALLLARCAKTRVSLRLFGLPATYAERRKAQDPRTSARAAGGGRGREEKGQEKSWNLMLRIVIPRCKFIRKEDRVTLIPYRSAGGNAGNARDRHRGSPGTVLCQGQRFLYDRPASSRRASASIFRLCRSRIPASSRFVLVTHQ